MEDRGPRSVEYIEAMRSIWNDDDPEYDGGHVSFSGVKRFLAQSPATRTTGVMGGHSKAAWRRTVTDSEGWYGFMLDQATSQNLWARRSKKHERPDSLGPIEITVTPACDPEPK